MPSRSTRKATVALLSAKCDLIRATHELTKLRNDGAVSEVLGQQYEQFQNKHKDLDKSLRNKLKSGQRAGPKDRSLDLCDFELHSRQLKEFADYIESGAWKSRSFVLPSNEPPARRSRETSLSTLGIPILRVFSSSSNLSTTDNTPRSSMYDSSLSGSGTAHSIHSSPRSHAGAPGTMPALSDARDCPDDSQSEHESQLKCLQNNISDRTWVEEYTVDPQDLDLETLTDAYQAFGDYYVPEYYSADFLKWFDEQLKLCNCSMEDEVFVRYRLLRLPPGPINQVDKWKIQNMMRKLGTVDPSDFFNEFARRRDVECINVDPHVESLSGWFTPNVAPSPRRSLRSLIKGWLRV